MVARLVIPGAASASRWTIDLIVSTGKAATRLAEMRGDEARSKAERPGVRVSCMVASEVR
jgi:hypothetical protein